jgi:hypothetical protein
MTPYFRQPPRPDDFPDDDGDEPRRDEDLPRPADDETEGEEGEDYGEGYDEEPEAEDRPGRGQRLLTTALLLIGAIFILIWGVGQLIDRGIVKRINEKFSQVSLLPANRLQPVNPELQLKIYYIIGDQALAAEVRQLAQPAHGVERLNLIKHEIMTPPSSRLLRSPLPPHTQIRSLFLKDGIAWVDLSMDFLKVDAPTPMQERLAIYALVNSFTMNEPGVKGVRLTIDGKPVQTAWGWLDLSSPLDKNLSLIQ